MRFERLDNAAIDTRDRSDQRAPFVLELSDQPRQAGFVVHRLSVDSFMAYVVIVDSCGEWPTFVGGGLSAF